VAEEKGLDKEGAAW